MGGVQHSTLLLSEQLLSTKKAIVNILFPGEGKFSQICKKKNIPYDIYNSIKQSSISLTLFNEKVKILNPVAITKNVICMVYNSYFIRKKIYILKPDVIISKGLLNHITSGLSCIGLKMPLIWHLQDLISGKYFGFLRFIFKVLGSFLSSKIICDGKIIISSLSKNHNKKYVFLPNGVDVESFKRNRSAGKILRKELNIPSESYLITNVARITKWKGQIHLLNAFVEYSKINLNSYLLLVGSPLFTNDNYYKSLLNIIRKNHIEDRVILPGYRDDINNVLSASDLFLYSSIEKDTLPLSLLSAMSSSLPVAISKIDSLIDIFELMPDIDRFDFSAEDEIVNIIQKYEKKENRILSGKKNYLISKENFDISKHTKAFLNIIKNTN